MENIKNLNDTYKPPPKHSSKFATALISCITFWYRNKTMEMMEMNQNLKSASYELESICELCTDELFWTWNKYLLEYYY